MKYKAGDTITLKLTNTCADVLNTNRMACYMARDIVSHTTAPEPVISYCNVYYTKTSGIVHGLEYKTKDECEEQKDELNRIGILITTYCPATKKVSAEIVG